MVRVKNKSRKARLDLVRHGSKHDIYAHPDKDFEIQIERHQSAEVKTGLFHKLKKQIGF